MHLDEVERWCDEMSNEIKISKSKNFIQVRLHAQYTKIIGLLINGKRFDAAKNFFPMRWGKFKLKLLIALVLPKIVISRIKN
jgi:hypothetical protein